MTCACDLYFVDDGDEQFERRMLLEVIKLSYTRMYFLTAEQELCLNGLILTLNIA